MHLSEAAAAAPIPRAYVLTGQERQVLNLREKGLSLLDIAERVGSSEASVTRSLQRLRAAGIAVAEPGGPDGPWSDQRVATLRRRAKDGRSASEVAEEIGMSRSAVLGKAKRLGVAFGEGRDWWTGERVFALRRLALGGATGPAIAAQLGTTAQKVREKARLLKITLKLAKPGLSPVPAVRAAAAEIGRTAVAKTVVPDAGIGHATSLAAAPSDAITIHELVGARCHWPFGDPRDTSFRYCGAPMADPDDPRCLYCARHREIAGAGQGRGR